MEQPSLAVALGLVVVAGPTSGCEVGKRGGAMVGHRVDVVPFQPVAAATAVGAHGAVEVGRMAEFEGGAQFHRYVAPEVDHGVDAHTIVGEGLEEGVVV